MQKLVNYIVMASPFLVSSVFIYKSQYPAWANSLFISLAVALFSAIGLALYIKKNSEISILSYVSIALGLISSVVYTLAGPDSYLLNLFGKGLMEWTGVSILGLSIIVAYVLVHKIDKAKYVLISAVVISYTLLNYFLITKGMAIGAYTGYLNVPMVSFGKLVNYPFVLSLSLLVVSLVVLISDKKGIVFATVSNRKYLTNVLVWISIIGLCVGAGYYTLRYVAASRYIRSSVEFSAGNLSGAKSLIASAISIAPFDTYYLGRIELVTTEIQNILNSTSTDKEGLQRAYVDAVNSQVADAKSAVAYDPKNPRNYMALGLAYERSMLVDKDSGYTLALEAYEKARALAEDKDYVDVVKAKMAFSAEKEQDALASIDRALTYNASSAPALFISSQYYASKNNLKPAIDYAEKAVQVAPLAEDARMQLGLLQFKNNDFDKALDMFIAAYRISQNTNNLALYYLGQIYKIKGDNENLNAVVAELESRVGSIAEVLELKKGILIKSNTANSASTTPSAGDDN